MVQKSNATAGPQKLAQHVARLVHQRQLPQRWLRIGSQILFLAIVVAGSTLQLGQWGDTGWGRPASVAAQASGPGGVAAGLRFWVRADSGVATTTQGGAVAQWNDQSGNGFHLTQATTSQRPTYETGLARTNYNPALRYNDDFLRNTSRILQTTDGVTMIGVGDSETTSGIRSLISMGDNYNDPTIDLYGSWILTWFDGGGSALAFTNESLPTRQPLIWSLRGDYNVRYGMRLANQGQEVPVNLTVVNQRYYGQNVSMGGDGWGEDWLGLVYEGIIYNRKLTSAELQRVQSYLALKYGVTLRPVDNDATIVEGDYVAADGLTKVWDYSANRAYHNSVAGIGRDDATALQQKQAHSINDGVQPVIGLGAIAANNAANPNTFAVDKSYLVWGSDTGSSAFGASYSSASLPPVAGGYLRMGRVWKVQETGQVDTVRIQGPTIADLLLVSNDPTFTTGVTEVALTHGQGAYNFSNGQYFTFGVENLLTAGSYRLAVAHSMKCLAVSGSFNGANVEQESCAYSAPEQQWQLEVAGNNLYKLRNVNTGKIMEVDGGSTSNGRNVEQNDDQNRTYQQWRLLLQEDGAYQLVAAHSNKCAGITYGSLSNGANLEQGTCATSANYRIVFLPLRTAPTGLYTLTALHSSQCVEVAGAGLTIGAALQQGVCTPAATHQQWYLSPVGDGVYKLINYNSGKVLEVAGGSSADGATLQQYDYVAGSNQQWRLIAHTDGSYQLVAVHSSKCVDVVDSGAVAGVKLQQAPCTANPNQRFLLGALPLAAQGVYTLRAQHSGQCLEVAGANPTAGANVQQGPCDATAYHQRWQLLAVGDGYYRLINLNSGKVLEVADANSGDGANVRQGEYAERDEQQWKIMAQPDGAYELGARHSNKCVDVAGGANAQQATCTPTASQRFTLTPVELLPESVYTIKAVHSSKCLEVAGASLTTGSPIQQSACNPTLTQQQWQPVALGDGSYKLVNRNSGKVLAVPGDNLGAGIDLAQTEETGAPSQRWQLVARGGGALQLVAGHSNKCADVYGAAQADGTKLIQQECGPGTSQRFYFLSLSQPEEAVYAVKAVHSGKCLAVAGASLDPGAITHQVSCDPTATAQQWQFVLQSNNHYKLINRNSGKVLAVAGGNLAADATVQQGDDNGGHDQQWQVIAQADGADQLMARHSNRCLAVADGATADGAPFRQMDCTTTTAARFQLLPISLGSQQVTEGIYTVQSLHGDQCMGVAGSSLESGAAVNQTICNPAQLSAQWQVITLGGGGYKIVNRQSGKVLEIAGGSMAEGANVQQGDENGGAQQQWRFVSQGDGAYQLVAGHSNQCVDAADSGTLHQAACTTTASQRFRLFPAALAVRSRYRLQAIHSDQCLVVAGASLSSGSPIQTGSCDPAALDQLWRLTALGNSYYTVINLNSNRVLAVTAGSTADGAPLQQGDDQGSAHQQWKLTPQVDGSYQLVALHSNQCVDATTAMQTPGAPVTQAPCAAVIEQRFNLVPSGEPTVTDFEANHLDGFTNGNGGTLTAEVRSGQSAASAPTTATTVAQRDLISPAAPVVVSAWVKGVGTAYLTFVGSDAIAINQVAQAVNSTSWQRVDLAATAPAGAAYYDLVFHADNGAFLVDKVTLAVNEMDTDGDGLSDRVESCRNLGSLNYEFYDGAVRDYALKNLPVSGAVAQGVVTNFDVGALQSQVMPTDPTDYGIRYSGYLWIGEAGLYTFFTNADDGAQLWINQRLVVDNDGTHGLTERSGTVYLDPGIHHFHLLYSAFGTPNALAAVQWSGPSFSKGDLPFNRLLSCAPELDSDGDGLPNYRDLDADDDTIPDAVENGE